MTDSPPIVPWVVRSINGAEIGCCLRCGAGLSLPLPLPFDTLVEHVERFAGVHKLCEEDVQGSTWAAVQQRMILELKKDS